MFHVPEHKNVATPAKAPGQIINRVNGTPRVLSGSLAEIIERIRQQEADATRVNEIAHKVMLAPMTERRKYRADAKDFT